MIRHSEYTSESWKNLPWKKFRRNLFRLQVRLFKAVQAGDMRKARSLQKLILKSKAARFLAIRQVTQLNTGKKLRVLMVKRPSILKNALHLRTISRTITLIGVTTNYAKFQSPKRMEKREFSKFPLLQIELGNA